MYISSEWTIQVVCKIETHPTGTVRSMKNTGTFTNYDQSFKNLCATFVSFVTLW